MSGARAYLVGVPGAGKTTLMRHLTAGLRTIAISKPLAHMVYLEADGPRIIGMELGGRHDTFGGTDRLSMSVQPSAIALVARWASDNPESVIVAEGDRLATATFLDALGGDLVWLDTPAEEARARRDGRSMQNAVWIRGRETKVRNLVSSRPHIRLDGALTPEAVADQAKDLVPAYAALAKGAHHGEEQRQG